MRSLTRPRWLKKYSSKCAFDTSSTPNSPWTAPAARQELDVKKVSPLQFCDSHASGATSSLISHRLALPRWQIRFVCPSSHHQWNIIVTDCKTNAKTPFRSPIHRPYCQMPQYHCLPWKSKLVRASNLTPDLIEALSVPQIGVISSGCTKRQTRRPSGWKYTSIPKDKIPQAHLPASTDVTWSLCAPTKLSVCMGRIGNQ